MLDGAEPLAALGTLVGIVQLMEALDVSNKIVLILE